MAKKRRRRSKGHKRTVKSLTKLYLFSGIENGGFLAMIYVLTIIIAYGAFNMISSGATSSLEINRLALGIGVVTLAALFVVTHHGIRRAYNKDHRVHKYLLAIIILLFMYLFKNLADYMFFGSADLVIGILPILVALLSAAYTKPDLY